MARFVRSHNHREVLAGFSISTKLSVLSMNLGDDILLNSCLRARRSTRSSNT